MADSSQIGSQINKNSQFSDSDDVNSEKVQFSPLIQSAVQLFQFIYLFFIILFCIYIKKPLF